MMNPQNIGYAQFLSNLDDQYCITPLGDLFYIAKTPIRIGYISLCMHAGEEQYRIYVLRNSQWASIGIKRAFKDALLALWSVGTLLHKETAYAPKEG